MSLAILQSGIHTSATWRRFLWACAIVNGVLGVGCMLYVVETLLLQSERRFVENPADTMTRAMGLTHFTIGWLFLFTSPRLRNRAALARLTFWTLFGVAFCAVFAWAGGDKNPLGIIAFYSFFFFHETYDEAHLFKHSGELSPAAPQPDRFLSSLALSVSLTFLALLAGFQIVRGPLLGRSNLLQHVSSSWLVAAAFAALILAVLAWVATLQRAWILHGSIRETIANYQPLLAVYAGLIAILLIGSPLGSVGYNFVILLHGSMWLFFACGKMNGRNPKGANLWTWLRHTPAGLITLHVALMIAALALFALRSHVWERTGLVCDLVSKSWFPYWGIMHIAMSFWRK